MRLVRPVQYENKLRNVLKQENFSSAFYWFKLSVVFEIYIFYPFSGYLDEL